MTATPVGIVGGENLVILIGNGASPEVFAHPCNINTDRAIDFTSNVTETEVADCADQTLPASLVRRVRNVDFTISGAGKIDKTSVITFITWWKTGAIKNAKIQQLGTGANGGWLGTGTLILKDFKDGGTRGDYQDFTATFLPAGTWTWAASA